MCRKRYSKKLLREVRVLQVVRKQILTKYCEGTAGTYIYIYLINLLYTVNLEMIKIKLVFLFTI